MFLQKIFLGLFIFLGVFSFWGGSLETDKTYAGIDDTGFTISVGTLTPGSTALGSSGGSKKVAEGILGAVIEKLIIAFGVISLLIMTIGAGYMIIYAGQDEFLSRGKSIFSAGLISLAVALSSGMIVKLMAYLLYQ